MGMSQTTKNLLVFMSIQINSIKFIECKKAELALEFLFRQAGSAKYFHVLAWPYMNEIVRKFGRRFFQIKLYECNKDITFHGNDITIVFPANRC